MNLTKEDHEQTKIAVEILEMDVKNNWTMVGLPEKVALLKYIEYIEGIVEYIEGIVDELDITSSY